jgi:protein HOOK3
VEDLIAERDDALGRVRTMRQQLDDRRRDRVDASMRAEIDDLRGEVCVSIPS